MWYFFCIMIGTVFGAFLMALMVASGDDDDRSGRRR